jgi:hypothetical protein
MSSKEKFPTPKSESTNSPESQISFEQLTNLQLLEGLKQINFVGYKKLASDPKTSLEALSFLAENDFEIDVKCAVARNSNTPQTALNHLICISSLYNSEDKDRLFLSLSRNDIISTEALQLINKLTNNNRVRLEMANKINNPQLLYTYAKEVADSLNNDKTYEGNSYPSIEAKIQLSDKIDLAILLASNLNTPYEAKIILSDCGYKIGYRIGDKDCDNLAGYLKYKLFMNNLNDLSFLKELLSRNGGNDNFMSDSGNFKFKSVIAKSKEAPSEILQILSLEDSFVVPEYAIHNPNMPIEFLYELIANEHQNSKYAHQSIDKRINDKSDLKNI